MASALPPPVIASARVLEYAVIDDGVTFMGHTVIGVGGRTVGPVQRLAIASELSQGSTLLLHCDEDWNKLAGSRHGTIEQAKEAAEDAYSGVTARWSAARFSDADVDAFLDEEDEGLICSFCGRHPHEVEKVVTGHHGAAICDLCIRALRLQTRDT